MPDAPHIVYVLPQLPLWWHIFDFPIINFLNLVVVAATGYWVWRYTVETQRLRIDNHRLVEIGQESNRHAQQIRIDEMRPVLVFRAETDTFFLKNIGKGPALDIELRVSQVHTAGALTNLRNFFDRDIDRDLFTLAARGSSEIFSQNM